MTDVQHPLPGIVVPHAALAAAITADPHGRPTARRRHGYRGGKATDGVYQTIINQLPPHQIYIEAFLGAGAVLRHKRPAEQSIGIERDPDVLAHHWANPNIPGLMLVNTNALTWLAAHTWTGRELVYLDPPYVLGTRTERRRYYQFELEDSDHETLLHTIRTIPAPVAISGYWTELYADMLSDWRAVSFPARNHAHAERTDWLWCNYPEPAELHDYRYLGSTYRQRDNLRRQAKRWRARIARMNRLQRAALLWALAEDQTLHPEL